MISTLEINDVKNLPVPWWSKAKGLEGRNSFEFEPGINCLVGPNGSGKTTLLTLMKRALHCEQSYSSVVTQTSVDNMLSAVKFAFTAKDMEEKQKTYEKIKKSFEIIHDGLTAYNLTSTQDVGLSFGAFDNDFFTEGVINTVTTGSVGEIRLGKLKSVVEKMRKKEPVVYKIHKEFVNDTCGERIDVATHHLQNPKLAPGMPTVFMDEPSENFDIKNQTLFWMLLGKLAKEFQIIIATHSIFPLLMKDINYIELEPDYVSAVRTNVCNSFGIKI